MGIFVPGDRIEGKYKVIKLLGEGGMNRVYLVEDMQNGSQWALKVSRDPSEIDSNHQEIYNQFLKEVSILTTLKHKHLPVIRDYFSNGKEHFVIEEYIDGTSLAELLKKQTPGEKEVLAWALALCEVLEVLHSNNIIFRDLKPENVMLTKAGHLKLIDFDIARYYKPGKAVDTTLLGTPGYAAPETYGKAQSDVRSDIYSLGATLHQLLTDVDPQDNPFHFDPIHQYRKVVNREFEKIVMKAVQEKPADRFATISEMKNAMAKVMAHVSPQSPAAAAATPAPVAPTAPQKTSPVKLILQNIFLIIFFILFLRACIKGCVDSTQPSTTPVSVMSVTPGPRRTPPPTKPVPVEVTTSEFNVQPAWRIPESKLGSFTKGFWANPVGNSSTLFPPTYHFSPGKMTEVEMDLNPPVVRPGSLLVVKFRFRTHFHTQYGTKPWEHRVILSFAMPVDSQYSRGWGNFEEIPGRIVSYKVRSPDKVGGDSARVTIPITHDEAVIEGVVKWKPSDDVPALKYDGREPWKGPRVVLSVEQQWYCWQYTKGFVLGARQKK